MNAVSLLNSNVFKISLGFFFLGSILMGVVKKLRQIFTRNKKVTLLYLLFILITFGLVGLLSSSKVLNDTPLSSFIGIQVIFILLGILHLFTLKRFFPDLEEDKTNFFNEFLFTVVIVLVGFFAYINVIDRFRPDYSFTFLGAGICFMIPFLVNKLYQFAFNIPVPLYKTWSYPLDGTIKDPTKEELVNPAVISFEFQKAFDDKTITNFRIKAPENMEFGKLFYFFINDYNERHPESTVQFLDPNTQEPQLWNFYFKPNWYGSSTHIDYTRTVIGNNIKENDVIVCTRVT